MDNKEKHPPHAFGRAVAFYRKRKGWKQYSLAKAAGRQGSEIKRIEEAKTSPQVETIVWVAEALGIEPKDLLLKTLEFLNES